MTTVPINDDTPRAQYVATAAQTSFTYDWFIFTTADLKVYVDNTLKALTTDYTVTGANTENGGNVVFNSGLTAGRIVTIEGDVSYARVVDLQQAGKFDPDDYNLEQDRNIVLMKQLKRDLDRKVGLSTTSTADISDLEADLVAVAGELDAVVSVADNIADVTAVADNETNIDAVAANEANITIVATNIANINDVAALLPQNNYSATTNPTVNDDSGDGYGVGSKWLNAVADEWFVCADATVGAAVWVKISLTVDELGALASLNSVGTAQINNDAVTLAKIQNATANSRLLGSGASGSGADYSEITLGLNLSMSGTTLNAAGGVVLQTVYAQTTTVTACAVIAEANTIPANTDGTEILTATITMADTTNKLRISGVVNGGAGSTGVNCVAIFKDSVANAIFATGSANTDASKSVTIPYIYEFVPAAAGSITIKIRVGSGSSTFYTNADRTGARLYGGVAACTLILEEINA